MKQRRTILALSLALVVAVTLGISTAGAARRNIDGTMTGPGGFRFEGCGGIVSQVGSGTYSAKGLGQGTYVFDVCVRSAGPSIAFDGTATFTRGTGASITGTIDGSFVSGSGPTFVVDVTGGTGPYARTRGQLTIGPLNQSAMTNCNPRVGICLDWTDTGPLTGNLTHVHRP